MSAGGHYPKTVIAWNQQTNDVVSGLRECPGGYSQWIIKFNGAQGEPQEFRKVEYAYALMAQAFRRMVFNVIARNLDDHTRNFSFLMDTQGRWRLSPAYDLTFARGNRFTAAHQMTINGKDRNVSRENFAVLGKKFSIPDYQAIIDHVSSTVGAWSEYAGQAEISAAFTLEIGDLHKTSL